MPDHVSLSPVVEQAEPALSKLHECHKIPFQVKEEVAHIVVDSSTDDSLACLERCAKIFHMGIVRLYARVVLQWSRRQKWRLSSKDMTSLNGRYSLQSGDAMARRHRAGWQSF